MNEVQKIEQPAKTNPPTAEVADIVPKVSPEKIEAKSTDLRNNDASKVKNVTTSVIGNRLQLSADVSADEIDALKDMLTKYKEILQMMN